MADFCTLDNGKRLIDPGPSAHGAHGIESLMLCPALRGFDLAGKAKIPKAALIKGSLVHAGLAHLYQRRLETQQGNDPDVWLSPDDAIIAKAAREGLSSLDDKVMAAGSLVREYARKIAPLDDFEVVAVEHCFELKFFDKYPFTARIDIAIRRRGKVIFRDWKCLPAAAVVWTSTGWRTVGELVATNKSWVCAAWDGAKVVAAPALAPRDAGVQDVWRVTTKAGRVLRFGGSHPVLVRRSKYATFAMKQTETLWVAAQDLRVGDAVATPAALPDVPDAPTPDAMIAVMGALICDGALTNADFKYTKTNSATRGYYKSCLDSLGFYYRESQPEGRAPYVALLKADADALVEAGLARTKSIDKRVPKVLMAASRRQIGVLLGALLMGDGSATVVHDRKAKRDNCRINYTTRSEGLAHDVQSLFLRYGLGASVCRSKTTYRGNQIYVWNVIVVGHESKRRLLSAIERDEVVAPALKPKLAALRAAIPDNNYQTTLLLGPETDVLWDKVETALCVGRERCYDIEVPEYHTFVAEGVVTHNTTYRLEAKTKNAYLMSGQFSGHRAIGKAFYGEQFGGVEIFMLQFEEPRRFEPLPMPRAAADEDFANRVAYARELETALKAQYPDLMKWPKTQSEHSCMTRYGPCRAFDLCFNGPSAADGA